MYIVADAGRMGRERDGEEEKKRKRGEVGEVEDGEGGKRLINIYILMREEKNPHLVILYFIALVSWAAMKKRRPNPS